MALTLVGVFFDTIFDTNKFNARKFPGKYLLKMALLCVFESLKFYKSLILIEMEGSIG